MKILGSRLDKISANETSNQYNVTGEAFGKVTNSSHRLSFKTWPLDGDTNFARIFEYRKRPTS